MATLGKLTVNELIVNSDIQANQLAVTSDVQFSGPVVCSDIVYLDGGANSDLVSGLNADLFDGAQLDTDVTMAADTDVAVPTQHAVKYYVDSEIAALDAAKADDTAVVHDTGNETIAGVKTFSSVPLLPDNTIETNDIQNSAVTAAKIADGVVNKDKLGPWSAGTSSGALDESEVWGTVEGVLVGVVTVGQIEVDFGASSFNAVSGELIVAVEGCVIRGGSGGGTFYMIRLWA